MSTRRRPTPRTHGVFELQVKRARAGLGLFSGRPIPSGADVVEYTGPILHEDEWHDLDSRYLFAINDHQTIDGSSRDNLGRYVNHACRPNCVPEIRRSRVFIRALRDIAAGEEITYDYGVEYFEAYIAPRGCRCVTCDPPQQ